MNFCRPLGVIAPTLDGDVLAVLARADASFSARAVHRLLGRASESGVRKVLERLRKEGIVLAEPAGKAILYCLNRQHLAAACIEELANPRHLLIQRLALLSRDLQPLPVYGAIFGSVARGEAGPDSDLDMLLVRPTAVEEDDLEWRAVVGRLEELATALTGNACRSLEYGQREFSEEAQTEPVLRQIGREGLTFLGSPQQATLREVPFAR